VRTIGTAGGDSKTGAFLGSDFTFADIGSLDRADFSVKAVGDDTIDGKYWQFESMEMSNLESGGKTAWIFDSSKNLPGIDESYFTLRFLERGR
jgi:hypothetical protein